MLVGVISDVHANRVALRAVLEDMPEVDRLVCAGDVVGYNPWPADCVDALRDRDVPTVAGNHDRAVVTGAGFGANGMAHAGVEHARESLDDEDVLVMGHTHVQHHERYDDGIVLNPGSVGQPRDDDPRAAYAVVDLGAPTVEEHRVEYDVDRVVEAVEAAGLPRQTGERLRKGQ